MNSLYSKQELTINDLPSLGDKWLFVGIDLAPNEMLETGIAVIDRSRNICRMDKLSSNEDIIRSLSSLGPASNLIVALDVPKNLSIPGRFRQEEVKLHPLRIHRPASLVLPTERPIDRCSARVWTVLEILEDLGMLTFLYFNYLAKMRYSMFVPFRSRTPQGCRALQSMVKTHLGIQYNSTNLSPSSVLDAMVGAYAAWSIFTERNNSSFQSFKIYREFAHQRQNQTEPVSQLFLEPLHRLHASPR